MIEAKRHTACNKTKTVYEYVKSNWNDARYSKPFIIRRYKTLLEALMSKKPSLTDDLKPFVNEKELDREKVFRIVGKNKYQGFLAAMLWGGIKATHSKSRKESNAELAFSFDKMKVVPILTEVSSLLQKGKEKEAFEYLDKGEGKIDGIGISYLTKILFFFSPDKAKESLIFDRWGRFMHAALLIDEDPSNALSFYSFTNREDFKSSLEIKKGVTTSEIYMDYLDRMRHLANKTCKDLKIVSAGHLEAFLFGDILYKKYQNYSNPRFFLYNKVKEYYIAARMDRS